MKKKSFALSQPAPPNLTKEGIMRKLTKEQKRDIEAIAAKTDADIDFSDIPLQRDWSGAEIGKFYRPGKKPVTLRLDTDVIKWLKADGRGYQTKANWLLRQAMSYSQKKSTTTAEKRVACRSEAARPRRKALTQNA